jgi:hypothetical protein
MGDMPIRISRAIGSFLLRVAENFFLLAMFACALSLMNAAFIAATGVCFD